MRKASLVVTNSHYVREAVYRAYGVFARVNYPGVDVDAFQPSGSAERDHLVLCVGELRPHKAFDYAVETIAQIPASLRPRLAIVANSVDEKEKRYIQALAAERGVPLTICERIPAEEVRELYQRAKLTLYTSIMEPLGLVVLESMSSGTPVVGVREAGVRETVVDGVTGFLVERDPRRLAEAVQRLLEDEGLRARMGAAGRRQVLENWTWDRSISELEGLLLEIAESGGAVVAAAAGKSRAVHEDVTERVRPAAMTLAPAPTSDRRDAKEEER
jgi:glycosyltransferase involved in cell wall biosynthesis